MNRTLTATVLLLCAGLTACSNDTSSTGGKTSTPASATATQPLTATTAFNKIASTVKDAELSGTVTEANDPDHLLGRPNQYTSKVTFSDSRIKASDVEGTSKGDVSRGGEIEVFADPAAATARATYIQTVTKALPALAEYDYVHGTVVVRVSHYLTPTQAAAYKTATDGLN